MSKFEINVVPVKLIKHPNADALSIVRIRKFQVVVRTEDWEGVNWGIYIPPDSVVPNTEIFRFLFELGDPESATYRIQVKKLRGIPSMGLLIPVPICLENSNNLAEDLNITHYNPPIEISTGGEACKPPNLYIPIYDIESWYNYSDILTEGEKVVITEKIHGAQGRFVFHGGQLYCGSKREWKKDTEKSVWWQAIRKHPEILHFLQIHPNTIIYGEVFGCVQDLKYGRKNGEVNIKVFDIYNYQANNKFSNHEQFIDLVTAYNIPYVPILRVCPYKESELVADGMSKVEYASNIQEGIVIKPIVERIDLRIGRVILKKVSNNYYMRNIK